MGLVIAGLQDVGRRVAYQADWVGIIGPYLDASIGLRSAFFIFIFFISVFYKNIFSIWKFTEVYPGRPAAGRPGPGRPAAGRQGLIRKKKMTKNCRQVPGDRSPGSWAAGPQAARQWDGRPYFLQFSPFREIISHLCPFCNFLHK